MKILHVYFLLSISVGLSHAAAKEYELNPHMIMKNLAIQDRAIMHHALLVHREGHQLRMFRMSYERGNRPAISRTDLDAWFAQHRRNLQKSTHLIADRNLQKPLEMSINYIHRDIEQRIPGNPWFMFTPEYSAWWLAWINILQRYLTAA